jgi:hypothetical protein
MSPRAHVRHVGSPQARFGLIRSRQMQVIRRSSAATLARSASAARASSTTALASATSASNDSQQASCFSAYIPLQASIVQGRKWVFSRRETLPAVGATVHACAPRQSVCCPHTAARSAPWRGAALEEAVGGELGQAGGLQQLERLLRLDHRRHVAAGRVPRLQPVRVERAQRLFVRCRLLREGFRVGDDGSLSRRADFPRHDCSLYRGLHVRRECFGFAHRFKTNFCRRPVPNLRVRFATFPSLYCARASEGR